MTRTLAILALLITAPAMAVEPGCYTDPELRVIDGDSVEFEDTNIRLIGYDTPEVRSYECEEELALGRQASARLRELVETRPTILCITGTDCGHGRECGFLAVRMGQTINVGSILMSEGSAVPFVGEQGDWCE